MGQSQSKAERCRDVYLSLTEQEAACLDTEYIKEKTGAKVDMGHRDSPVSGRRIVIVRGHQTQIEAAAIFIDQMTGHQGGTAQLYCAQHCARPQLYWVYWTEAAFPDLDSRAYFLPPAYFNEPMSNTSGEHVLVPQSAPGQADQSSRPATTPSAVDQTSRPQPPPAQDSDVRDDAAIQRLFFCLQEMTEQKREVLIAMSNLQLRRYLCEHRCNAAPAQLPLFHSLPPARPRNWKRGNFDVLLIHRHYGFVICEVKGFGDNTQALNLSQRDIDNSIRKKLRHAVSLLNKAEAMLSHLVSDIAPGLRITKTIAFPNLRAHQLQQAISGDTQLAQDLCQCLGTSNPVSIAGLCLCSDQLSDPTTPSDVNEDVLKKLGEWWKRCVTVSGPDSHMTLGLYKNLVSRICYTIMGRRKCKAEGCDDICLSLNEQQAVRLDTEEIEETTGAEVDMDHHASPVSGRRIVVVRGDQTQIEAAVNLIDQTTGAQANTAKSQLYWFQWVEAAFPDVYSHAYFLPPVDFNRVPMTRTSITGYDALVLPSAPGQAGQYSRPATTPSTAGQSCLLQPPGVQDSDVRDDTSMQRLLFYLQEMTEQKEVLFAMSNLQFGQYLGEPCYAAAAAQLPLPANLASGSPQNWKQGDFDVLLIHRRYGFAVIEVKAIGDNTQTLNMSQQDIDNNIRKKLEQAVSQLDKAEAMLSHLVSDIAPGLRITKTIAFPNLTARQVQQAISGDTQLAQNLSQCLGTSDTADIAGVCLCSDQLSDPKTKCDCSSHVLQKLGKWWARRVTVSGRDSHMTCHLYKMLISRFCGPATTVTVPCTSPPRLSIKTQGQTVSHTGECYTAVITLFPEQVHLLHTAPPTLFVTGPPGTGKTVVLLLMGIQWLRCGHQVDIVSTWWGSRAACSMLYHVMLQAVKKLQSSGVTPGQLHLLQYDLHDDEDVEYAVNDLCQGARGGSLFVIADEAVSVYSLNNRTNYFKPFCEKLLTLVPRLHLWAASCFHEDPPAGWQVEYLTRPLRSPPVVVREVKQDVWITKDFHVHPYRERGVPDHTDGPPVRRLYHGGQGHSGSWPVDCVTCGREVASFLHSLRVGVTGSGITTSTTVTSTSGGTTTPCLQWRDVLVLSWCHVTDNSGVVTGLQEAGIPVRRMKDEDIEDVATARSDVVWLTDGDRVRGLERKVVVCLEDDPDVYTDRPWPARQLVRGSVRLDFMSRCTAHLVIVSLDQ